MCLDILLIFPLLHSPLQIHRQGGHAFTMVDSEFGKTPHFESFFKEFAAFSCSSCSRRSSTHCIHINKFRERASAKEKVLATTAQKNAELRRNGAPELCTDTSKPSVQREAMKHILWGEVEDEIRRWHWALSGSDEEDEFDSSYAQAAGTLDII